MNWLPWTDYIMREGRGRGVYVPLRPGQEVTTKACKRPVIVAWVTSSGAAVGRRLRKDGTPGREVYVMPQDVIDVRVKLPGME